MIEALSYLDWRDVIWQYMMTVVSSYPEKPSEVLKKKMYRFISDVPSMVPDPEFRRRYIETLTKYPIGPYLDSRDSLARWLAFFRNRIAELYHEPVKTEVERWETYKAALGPQLPVRTHHPKWYTLVALTSAVGVVLLASASGRA
jgi:hypothetical protein